MKTLVLAIVGGVVAVLTYLGIMKLLFEEKKLPMKRPQSGVYTSSGFRIVKDMQAKQEQERKRRR